MQEGDHERGFVAVRPRIRSMRGWRAYLAAHGFGLRLAATVVLTLLTVGALGYALTGAWLERRLVADRVAVAEGHAEALREAYLARQDYAQSRMMAAGVIEGIISDPSVSEAMLLDPGGAVAADHTGSVVDTASTHRTVASPVGPRHPPASAGGTVADHPGSVPSEHAAARDEALATGEVVTRRGKEHGELGLWVPVQLPTGTHVLHVGVERSATASHLAGLRRQAGLTILLGLPVAAALFFLLGGRTLIARHRRVVESSLRDSLTQLGNHRAFQEELARMMGRAARSGEPMVCALIDLDDFKAANDAAGHHEGDVLLQAAAAEIAALRADDPAFRVGGDEFALIMERTTLARAQPMLERLRCRVAERFSHLTISAGCAEAHAGDEPGELLQRADAALYDAKGEGRNTVRCYDWRTSSARLVHPRDGRALRALLARDEMGVVFQPIWDLGDGDVVGYEALARPPQDSGFSGPAAAFEVARKLGHTHELDAQCRRVALGHARALPAEARLFLNVSPEVALRASLRPEAITGEVRANGREPATVVLEITEQAVVDVDALARQLRALQAHGFRVALDDVGAGNAGFELLRRVPAEFVKVDRGVVVDAITDEAARGVLLAVLAFAQQAGSYVIAEGIETATVLEYVRGFTTEQIATSLAIHAAQGFVLGCPAPAGQAHAESADEGVLAG